MMPSSTVRSSTGMKTVGEIAISVAGALKIFRRIGIDYGDVWEMPLDEALRTRDVDLDAILAEIAALEATPVSAPADSGELVDYIISHYHQVHRRELVELLGLARRVEKVHEDHPQAPAGLTVLLEKAQGELEDHMMKEERILFPSICSGYRGSLFGPIVVMRHEHDDHAKLIHSIYLVTSGLNLPANACGSWRALYAGLEKLTTDLIEHIHIENDVLFPRFMNAR